MKKEGKIVKFLLEVPEHVWVKWKDSVPRSISLNKAINTLFEKEIEKHEK